MRDTIRFFQKERAICGNISRVTGNKLFFESINRLTHMIKSLRRTSDRSKLTQKQGRKAAQRAPEKPLVFWERGSSTWKSEGCSSNRAKRWDGPMVKFKRALGECLGIRSRRWTCYAAISYGELQISIVPWISEWGNPAGQYPVNLYWIHRYRWGDPLNWNI